MFLGGTGKLELILGARLIVTVRQDKGPFYSRTAAFGFGGVQFIPLLVGALCTDG